MHESNQGKLFFFKILFHELYKYLNNDDKKRKL